MEGMISKELVELQKFALVETPSKLTVEKWSKELVIRLLEITHGQWLYRNVMVHDRTAGDLVTRRKGGAIRRNLLASMLSCISGGSENVSAFCAKTNVWYCGVQSESGILHAWSQ